MNAALSLVKKAHEFFGRSADLLQAPFLLALRAFWGWQLVQSGWGKLHNIDKVVDFFASLNLPAPPVFARAVSVLELVGGVLLLLGLCSRPIALLLTGNMVGAYITADADAWHAFFSDDSGKFFAADPFPYLMVSLVVLVFGPGLLSLDTLIFGRPKKPGAPS